MSTPETPPAGLIRRLLAMIYDALLLTALLFVATGVVVAARGGAAVPPENLPFAAYLVAVMFLFFGWFWTHGGQTLGMRTWRIRVQQADGTPLDWRRAALRFAAAAVSLLAFGLGFLWVLVDRRRRAWHDLWTGTIVVYLPRNLPSADPAQGEQGAGEE